MVYDSSDPAAKPLARDIFTREIAQPGVTAELASRAGEALVAKGYHAQVTPHEGAISLFHLDSSREAIKATGDRGHDRRATRPRWRRWPRKPRHTPEHFSPNVLLRPIVQDTIFPTICYVAGPNELAYLGPAARGLRPLRHPDAADVSARHRHAGRFRDAALSSASTACRSKRCSRRTRRR